MSMVIDLNAVCLVCLQNNGGDFESVFAFDEQSQLTVAEKISRCSELMLHPENSKLPDKICYRCLLDLTAAWRFRQNCETANSVFQSIQQQEEESEALANYELKCQKIKLPSGLKIRRLNADIKTCVVPVDLEKEQIEGEEFWIIPQEEENTLEEEVSEMKNEEMSELEGDASVDEGQTEDLQEYYEAEEILDEIEAEEKYPEEENEEEDEEEVVENAQNIKQQMEEQKRIERESAEDEDFVLETAQKRTPAKHKRGRPKKLTQPSALTENQTKQDDAEKVARMNNSLSEPLKAKESLKSSTSNKSIITRKRKSGAHSTKICEICGNTYKYQHALNAHMRRHTNERPFGCEFCDKAFVSGVELRRHMRVHTGQKPYGCSYCDRRFSDFGSRIKHERTHTGERPYRCSTCDKTFAYAHVLSVHLRTHTGEKKFICPLCNKGFTKKAYLQSHMEQHIRSGTNVCESSHQLDLGGSGESGNIVTNSGNMSDVIAIKTVALEESIFTTEYIKEEGDEEQVVYQDAVVEMTGVEEEDNIEEEHLEDGEIVLGIR